MISRISDEKCSLQYLLNTRAENSDTCSKVKLILVKHFSNDHVMEFINMGEMSRPTFERHFFIFMVS